jgi:hypothetical protein
MELLPSSPQLSHDIPTPRCKVLSSVCDFISNLLTLKRERLKLRKIQNFAEEKTRSNRVGLATYSYISRC